MFLLNILISCSESSITVCYSQRHTSVRRHMPIHWLSSHGCDLGQPCEYAGAVEMVWVSQQMMQVETLHPEEGCSLLDIKLSSRKSLSKRGWHMLLVLISQNTPKAQGRTKPMRGSSVLAQCSLKNVFNTVLLKSFSCSNRTLLLLSILYVTWSLALSIK